MTEETIDILEKIKKKINHKLIKLKHENSTTRDWYNKGLVDALAVIEFYEYNEEMLKDTKS